MKKFLMILTTALLGLMVGCTTYNDSRIWEAIDELEEQVANQQALLLALSNNLTICSITETEEGFVVTFSDNTTITIKHGEDGKDGDDGKDGKDGKDGEDGEDGTSVIVSVTWDDQNAYFTLSDGSVITIPLSTLGEEGEVDENNKIYYTSYYGRKIFPYQAGHAAFDAVLLSNTYENGVGCMTFDDKVTCLAGVFRDSALTSIILPNSTEQLYSRVFADCLYLEEITIPENVYWLSAAVFDGCVNLKRIYCTPTTPPQLGEDPLGEIPADLKIYVPEESLAAYLASDWSAYANHLVGYDYGNIGERYKSWLGNWTVKGDGLEYVEGEGYVNPIQIEFTISITQAVENESFYVDGWNGFTGLPIFVEYDFNNDALILAAGTVATDVKFTNGQVASQIILAGIAVDGGLYEGYDLAYAIRGEEGAAISPFKFTSQDGSETYFTHTAFLGVFEDGTYYLTDSIPSTTLTMTPAAASAPIAAPLKTMEKPVEMYKVGDVKFNSINF